MGSEHLYKKYCKKYRWDIYIENSEIIVSILFNLITHLKSNDVFFLRDLMMSYHVISICFM